MKFILKVTSFILLIAFAPATAVLADPMPRIDWEQIDDSLENKGDHVVGEELC